MKTPRSDDEKGLAEDLVRFFHALRPEVRRQYEALAERDRELGEDVGAERRRRGTKAGGS